MRAMYKHHVEFKERVSECVGIFKALDQRCTPRHRAGLQYYRVSYNLFVLEEAEKLLRETKVRLRRAFTRLIELENVFLSLISINYNLESNCYFEIPSIDLC